MESFLKGKVRALICLKAPKLDPGYGLRCSAITVAIKDVPTRSGSVDWERSGTHNSKSEVLDAPFFVGRTLTGRYGTLVLAGATASVEEAAASKSPTARASASSGGANE